MHSSTSGREKEAGERLRDQQKSFDAKVRNSIRGNEETDRRVCGQSAHVVTAACSLLDSRNEKSREHQAPESVSAGGEMKPHPHTAFR